MKGAKEYSKNYERKIDGVLQEHPELRGFYSYMSDKSLGTVYSYLCKVIEFIEYTNKPSDKLDIDDFAIFLSGKRKKDNDDEMSSSHRITLHSALKKYGKYLKVKGILQYNPMDDIDRPAAKESQQTIIKREKGFLDKDEIKTYIDDVKNGVGNTNSLARQEKWRERDIAIILVFLNTGIRSAALYKLDVDSIDFDKKTLTVTDKESKVNIHSLSDDTIAAIYNWIIKRNKILLEKNKVNDALFISNRMSRMSEDAISDVVKKYSKNITGKNITPHKLRATYGTQLYEGTKDIYFVQKCMNHSSPKVTELYVRGNTNKTKDASDIMEKLFK